MADPAPFGLLALLGTWLAFFTVKAVPLSLTSWYTGPLDPQSIDPGGRGNMGLMGHPIGPAPACL